MTVTKKHLMEVDLIKGLAIISVVLVHCLPYNDAFMTLRMFTFSMALLIFMLLMGRNMYASFEKHNYMENGFHALSYLKNRLVRFLYPFIPVFVISIILGLLTNQDLYFGLYTLVGYLPLPGPGNYFVTVLLQFIIIFPLLYLAYKRYPWLTLIATFAISLLFELISPYISALNADAYIYYANILRYLFVITLGLWVLEAFEPTKRIRSNLESFIVLIGLVVGVIYMVAFGIFHWEVPFFNTFWGTEYPTLGSYVVIVAFYPLVLYMLAYRILPSNSENKIIKFIAYVGKASYHVFLVQILFFAVFYNPYATISQSGLFDPVTSGIISIVVSLAVTLPLGALFYKYEYVFDNILDRLFRIKKDDSDLTSGRSLKKQN